ncbi:helix-turn-helix protein [Micromonospora pisi]|uniref:Helix-turn-helix protein n=1 Tax=Micromonospora pisi TaxID=589240 RepID=A0A495JN14_9ACTN|nr:helix-turn-helix transcriptional regulator [Micromonospora pisi]RKR90303.1 helix-turn-helix protein [Micromonospora pisi]
MARHERPVDPTAGPLSSFAHELRKLRVEAGNPTYRRLAELAGYSASTLSAAANGIRQPSLDVVLAYVGACGGDTAQWRQRWLELDKELRPTGSAGAPADPVGAGAAEPPSTVTAEDSPAPTPDGPTGTGGKAGTTHDRPVSALRHRKLRRRLVLAAVAVAGLAGMAAVVPMTQPKRATKGVSSAAAPTTTTACPATTTDAAFTAVTYGGGVHVRSEPRRDKEILYTIPPGCVVGLTGYCLGERIIDSTSQTPDIRWFTLAGGGLIASGVVHGNPPAGLEPSRCAGDRPGPASIAIAIAPDVTGPGRWRLSATGTHVEIVGFAAYYADDPALPGDRRWHQIGMTGTTTPPFDLTWNLDQLAAHPGPTTEIPVAAVACLGGGAPTDVLDVRVARPDGSSAAEALPLAAEQRLAARRSACLYP